jgi:Spy/CpxP family protein refolding chaperone
MKLWKIVGASVVAGAMSLSLVSYAQDAKAEKGAAKAEKAAAAGKKGGKLPAPYNQIASLSEEQKAKISEIRAKADAEKKAIEEKAKTEIDAVLTDAQRAEVKAAQEKPKAGKEGAAKAEKAAKELKEAVPAK